jgi:hypothetical protein
MMRVELVDRGHQLDPILDLCAGDEPIIGENEFKRAVVVLKFQPPNSRVSLEDFAPTGFQFLRQKRH